MIEIRPETSGKGEAAAPIRVAQSRVTIGRGDSCDVTLDDSTASRLHLVLRRKGRDWVAEDQGSRNGSFLGEPGRKIHNAILRPGDLIQVGNSRMRVHFEDTLPVEVEHLRFEIVEPAELAREILCTRESVTIGRHPSSDVFIDDPTVSRLHAVVARTQAGYVLNDQQATNAIYIGDPPERVTAAVLYDGQVIRLGNVKLRVSVPSELPTQPEAPQISDATAVLKIVGARPPADLIQARLAKAPLFQGFDEEDWALFLQAYERDDEIEVRTFEPDDVVCEAGRFDLYFRIVLQGEVAALDPQSGEQLLGHGPGDFFGMIDAKRSLARPTRHVALCESRVLCMPRQHIRYVERNAAARALIEERHKEESWRVMASQLDLFDGVPAALVAQLMENSRIEFHDKAGITLIKQGEPGEFMAIVRDGFLKVVQERDKGPERILGYLRKGDSFGEVALLDDSPRTASVVTAGKAEVVKIYREDFRTLCYRHPEIADRLDQNQRLREERADPELDELLHKFGQGYIQADALLVMDLELCVKCDLCVEACESLHGTSRLQRRGMQIGQHLAPSACRHCDDPVCMFSCPTGAIKRRPEGEIYIDYDLCTGVGACALACPYDNIQMVDTHSFDQAQARKAAVHPGHDFFRPFPDEPAEPGLLQRMLSLLGSGKENAGAGNEGAADDEAQHHVPPTYPIKCDLCDGLPFMGCVHACPTGAAMRVDPRTLLRSDDVVSSGSVIGKAGKGRKR